MNKKFDFNKQLKFAITQEQNTIDIINTKTKIKDLIHHQGKDAIADAYSPSLNEWIELKIDTTKTINHFIERYSKIENHVDGGPWQYNKKNVKYYVFNYINTNELYIFKTIDIINLVELLLKKGVISDLKNGKMIKQTAQYNTYGYAIPRKYLKKIEIFYTKY